MLVSSALSTLLVLAGFTSAANVPRSNLEGGVLDSAAPATNIEARANAQVHKLFARADVISEKNGIHAHFEFTGYLDGSGTFIKIAVLKGLVKNDTNIGGGPYGYHIHTNPIGEDGDCGKALAHLDPLDVTESLICDPAFPKYCQEGDLSGKHGKFNGTADGIIERYAYTDDYVRFFPEDFSILGRSVVIHAPNKTRIACGNIISTLDDTADWHFGPTGRPSTYVKNYPSVAPAQPPQVVTPFVGEVFPDLNSEPFKNLPFALANEAIPIRKSLNVKYTTQQTSRSINGTVTTVTLPSEIPVNDTAPFKGFYDHSWF